MKDVREFRIFETKEENNSGREVVIEKFINLIKKKKDEG